LRVGDNLEFQDALHDATSNTDCLIFRAPFPCRIVRFGALVSVTLTGGAGSIECDVTEYPASGVGVRSSAKGGNSCDFGALKAGAVAYAEPLEGPANEILLKAGDLLHLQQTTVWTAGDYTPFIQYQQLNWDDTSDRADFSDATPTTRMVNGATVL